MSAENVDDRPVTRPSPNVQSLARALKLIAAAARVLMVVAPLAMVAEDVLFYPRRLIESGDLAGQPWWIAFYLLFFVLYEGLIAAEAYLFFGFVRFFAVYFGTVIEKRYL